MRLAVFIASIACAGGQRVRTCAPSLADPAVLAGEGEADAAAPEAAEIARRRAVAAISEQVRVEVRSRFRADEQVQVTGAGERAAFSAESTQETRSDAVLDGAEVLDTCAAGGVLRVRLGLRRDRFFISGGRQLEARAEEVRSADAGAADALRRGARLEAARLWAKAAADAAQAERLRDAIRVVARSEPSAVMPSSRGLESRARGALAGARIAIHAEPALAESALVAGAWACLSRAGLPMTEGPADATLSLRARLDPALKVAPGLFVVRGQLTAVLERAGTTPSGSGARIKGGGVTADGAAQDAIRRLATDALPTLVDAALADWPSLPRCTPPK